MELARSASLYSRKTKRVVDETVSLSATLVRAGEVEEANRLMAEAEREVRTEEAALIETVNEVKVAGEVRKRRLLRLKLFKAVATAGLSGSMFVVSAFGVVLARGVMSDDPAVHDMTAGGMSSGVTAAAEPRFHDVVVGPGIKLRLTPSEAKELARLTETLDADGLRRFLSERVPTGLLDEVQTAILNAVAQTIKEIPKPSASAAIVVLKEQAKEASKQSPEPSPSPKPSESPSPEPEDSPSPRPNTGDGETDGDGNGGQDGPLGNLPLPGSDADEDQG